MDGAGTTGDVATEPSEPPKASPAVRPQLLPAWAGGRAPLSDPAVAPIPCPRYRHLLLDVAEHLLPLLVEPLLQLALRTLLLLLQHPQLAELLAPKGGASWGGRGAASLEKAPLPAPASLHSPSRARLLIPRPGPAGRPGGCHAHLLAVHHEPAGFPHRPSQRGGVLRLGATVGAQLTPKLGKPNAEPVRRGQRRGSRRLQAAHLLGFPDRGGGLWCHREGAQTLYGCGVFCRRWLFSLL